MLIFSLLDGLGGLLLDFGVVREDRLDLLALDAPRDVVLGDSAYQRHKGDDVPFSPFLAMSEYLKARRAARVTPIDGKQRTAPHGPRVLGGCWTTDAYTKTIRAAGMKAGITPWGANRLRHAFGTEVRRAFGLDAARAVLGHTNGGCITDVYTFDALEEETIRRASPAVESLG